MKRATTMLVGAICAVVLAACGADDSRDENTAEFCAPRMEEYSTLAESMDSSILGPTVPDSADVEQLLTQMQAAVHDVRDTAPDEIADDVDVLAVGLDDVVSLMSDNGWDFSTLQAAELVELQRSLGGPEIAAAQQRLIDYTETCGLPAES